MDYKNQSGSTFLASLLSDPEIHFSQEEVLWIKALLRSYRSLFRIEKFSSSGLLLLDLWGQGHFLITERRRLPGLSVGDIFEARIFPKLGNDQQLIFSKTFLMHPPLVGPLLIKTLGEINTSVLSRHEFLGILQRLRLRCIDYKHLSKVRVYESFLESTFFTKSEESFNRRDFRPRTS